MKKRLLINRRGIIPALLVSLMMFGSASAIAGSSAAKEKKKGKVVVFSDGWQNLRPAEGEFQTGNFTAISVLGEPKQQDNKKWTGAWGNWTVSGTDGSSKRGVIMVPAKAQNEDWLISSEIDLEGCKKPVLSIEGYSKYGTDNGNELKVMISENYQGDVESANWEEMWMESFHKQNQSVTREINLKKYQGKKVVIAFCSSHKGKSLKNLTRTTFISSVQVKAIKK